MTRKPKPPAAAPEVAPAQKPAVLEGSLKTATVTDAGIELIVRLRNPGGRALHYISEVRALPYDPVSRKLTVRLSDEGSQPPPASLGKLPDFRAIDPESEAEISLALPPRLIRFSHQPNAAGQLVLEELKIVEATQIEVAIGWADTPFYADPRKTDDKRMPAARWQQGELRVVGDMRSQKPAGV
jgi:hypothetical protein